MRIISSRKFRFYTPNRQESFVTEGKNIIQDCPDWAKDDDTFQAAHAAGLLQIISSGAMQRRVENEPEKVLPQNAHEAKALLDSQNEVHMDEETKKEDIKWEEEEPDVQPVEMDLVVEEAPKKKRNRKKKIKE